MPEVVRKTDSPSFNSVFLSSTTKDILHLRNAAKSVLEIYFDRVEEAFPIEEWRLSDQPEQIIDTCKRHVEEADAYVLILGLWYGWEPPGQDKSITHLEFTWARNKWAHERYPRVMVLVPFVGGDTWRLLRREADRYIGHLEPAARERHKRKLDAFHREAIGGSRSGDRRWDWRIVEYYNNDLDLRYKFKERVSAWRDSVLMAQFEARLSDK